MRATTRASMQFDVRARASPRRAKAAQLMAAVVLADVPVTCFYTFCDFLFPDAAVVCVSRDTVAVVHSGSLMAGNRLDHAMDNGGDISDVAAAGKHLVVGRGMGFQVTSLETNTDILHTFYMGDTHASQVLAVDITATGIVGTAVSEGLIAIWEPSSYASPAALRTSPLMLVGHTDEVRHIKFVVTRHGRLLLVSASDDGKVCVWDPLGATRLHTTQFFPHSLRYATAVTSLAGDTTIAVAANSALGIYSWGTESSSSTTTSPTAPMPSSSSGRLCEVKQIYAHHAPITAMALGEGIVCSACESEVVIIHRTTGTCDVLARCRAKLATRLCASLMSCLTKILILACPPLSSAIVVACCSSDGDLIVFTAKPPETVPPEKRAPAVKHFKSNSMSNFLENAGHALAGVLTTALTSYTTQPQPVPSESVPAPGSGTNSSEWQVREHSTILETGAVVGMALCHVAFS